MAKPPAVSLPFWQQEVRAYLEAPIPDLLIRWHDPIGPWDVPGITLRTTITWTFVAATDLARFPTLRAFLARFGRHLADGVPLLS